MQKFYELSQDYLEFTGQDKLDLIHRLSTNDVLSLTPGNVIKTILTTDKGRFVDIISMFHTGDSIFVTCSFNNADKVINHLDKYTIMDDFKVERAKHDYRTLVLFDEDNYRTKEDFSFMITDNGLIIHDKKDIDLGTRYVIYPADEESVKQTYISGYDKMTDDEYEELRIQFKIPKIVNEMNELTNPLECHLEKYVSFTKGCYIGQEVIARLDTYDKISKHLVGFRSEEKINLPARFICDDKECGFVTSFINSEKYGYLGLGFIKTIFLSNRKTVTIKSDSSLIKAELIN